VAGKKLVGESVSEYKAGSIDPKSVIGRGFAILDTFDGGHRHQSLAAIARRSGLPLSTAHRIIHDLVELGALIRTVDGSYEIGSKIWRLGILASLHSDLREIALPYMEDIYQLGNDAVQIGVLDGFRCLIVERIAGSRTLAVISKPGARLPLHASGVGKVLLAHGSRELQGAVLGSLDKYTGKTITDAAVLETQLKEIKRLGFAHSQEELAIGATSLAVPITGFGNKVTAALGIVTPVANKDLDRMVSVLKVSASALSRKLVLSGMGDLSQRV
jgi:DNA-binding IclR family transcriptional regulator